MEYLYVFASFFAFCGVVGFLIVKFFPNGEPGIFQARNYYSRSLPEPENPPPTPETKPPMPNYQARNYGEFISYGDCQEDAFWDHIEYEVLPHMFGDRCSYKFLPDRNRIIYDRQAVGLYNFVSIYQTMVLDLKGDMQKQFEEFEELIKLDYKEKKHD